MDWQQKMYELQLQRDRQAAEAAKGSARAQKYQSITQGLNQVTMAFGDTADVKSDSTFEKVTAAQSVTAGLTSGVAIGTAIGGPVGTVAGAAAGVAIGAISFYSSKKRRKRMKEAALKRWKDGLEQYKQRVSDQKAQLSKVEKKVNQVIGSGATLDIQKQARRDIQSVLGLTKASRGAKLETAEAVVDDVEDTLFELVDSADRKLEQRVDLLEEAQTLAQKEVAAHRDDFGNYSTEYAAQLKAKIQEYEEL